MCYVLPSSHRSPVIYVSIQTQLSMQILIIIQICTSSHQPLPYNILKADMWKIKAQPIYTSHIYLPVCCCPIAVGFWCLDNFNLRSVCTLEIWQGFDRPLAVCRMIMSLDFKSSVNNNLSYSELSSQVWNANSVDLVFMLRIGFDDCDDVWIHKNVWAVHDRDRHDAQFTTFSLRPWITEIFSQKGNSQKHPHMEDF